MARAIERIEQDIAALEEQIRAIAAELHSAYASYLTTLGQALQKQLILASYHLCTQGYPEKFLGLSLNQRQKLQQAIRKLGQQVAEQLLTYMKSEEDRELVTDGESEKLADEENLDTNSPPPPTLWEEISSTISNPEELYTPSPRYLTSPDPSNPVELAKWQQGLEHQTQQTLKKVSHDANLVLQKADILPKKLPEPILEAAAAASEASAEVMPGPPNLLNLVIEIENEQDADDSRLTQLMAINLRLGEIEFADVTLSSSRKQIRNILVRLNKLGREYQKKQRERSIAEAESAWRASWFED
ncbi:hypothetical protein I8751_24780 [Nostocaceae cyanobacterium CENA357]|uniref:Uncharacterized protein n=1 Tax=Atlanticothrix silvestris CENA357 TaxID=1725252 RepID=A0A8J7L415_9CYAN|nr:hypothetical protein [Atlanticothrix silvestris]MBH8555500.1 hypothetical protein [Atlanticothrix silvestris CENA357]